MDKIAPKLKIVHHKIDGRLAIYIRNTATRMSASVPRSTAVL